MTSIGWKVLPLLVAATLGARGAQAASKPPLCTDTRRFAVAGDPLLGPGGEVVVFENRQIAIGTLCAARKAKLKRTKKGTSVKVTFGKGGCSGVSGKVKLTALITDDFSTMSGKLKAPKTDASRLRRDDLDVRRRRRRHRQRRGPATAARPAATMGRALHADPCVQVTSNKSSPIDLTGDGRKPSPRTSLHRHGLLLHGRRRRSWTEAAEVPVARSRARWRPCWTKPWVYVANTVSGTVSVIDVLTYATVATVEVGTEPWAVAASPNGHYVYVATANDNAVRVIDTSSNEVVATIPVGRSPRALAVTSDGDSDDLDELLYVPNFFARPRTGFTPPSSAGLGGAAGPGAAFPANSNGKPVVGEGIFDDSREAVVDVVSTQSYTVVDQVVLAPMADTGFNFARGTFVNSAAGNDFPRTIFADDATDGSQPQKTGAFPNLLQSIVLFDGRGFIPNSAASPEPPLRFNLNVQSLMSVFDLSSNQELGAQTFNMNRGINFRSASRPAGRADPRQHRAHVPIPRRWTSTARRRPGKCWVVSQGSDFVPWTSTAPTSRRSTRRRPARSRRARSSASSPSIRRTRRARAEPARHRAMPTARTATSSARRRATSSSRT
jgi:YVTN family beta-propeller protein